MYNSHYRYNVSTQVIYLGFFCGMMASFGEGDSFGQETYITTTYISLFRRYSDFKR